MSTFPQITATRSTTRCKDFTRLGCARRSRGEDPVRRRPTGINVQSPKAPSRVKKGTVVTWTFLPSFVPSLAVPKQHAHWAYVPRFVGREYVGTTSLRAILPCIHVKAATATSASRIVIVLQDPAPGTRLPAFGVKTGSGYKPSTVDLTIAARP
jgi:hypothetical protein